MKPYIKFFVSTKDNRNFLMSNYKDNYSVAAYVMDDGFVCPGTMKRKYREIKIEEVPPDVLGFFTQILEHYHYIKKGNWETFWDAYQPGE